MGSEERRQLLQAEAMMTVEHAEIFTAMLYAQPALNLHERIKADWSHHRCDITLIECVIGDLLMEGERS